MGNFPGHALPGSFFILFALWHALQLSIRYFRSKQINGNPFKSATYFTCNGCCGRVPWEAILKVFATAVGILGETYTAFDNHGVLVNWGNLQHIAMFSFFLLTAVIEILHHYKYHLPPNSVFVCYIMSFIVEGILFYWHLHGRSMMDVQIHVLLLYTIFGMVAILMVEMHYRTSILAALGRTYLMLLQGVWFWQAGFILYPPFGMAKWDENDHTQMMLVTVTFCIHCGLCWLLIGSIWFLVSSRYGMCRKPVKGGSTNYNSLAMKVLEGKDDQVRLIGRQYDENSEDELFTK